MPTPLDPNERVSMSHPDIETNAVVYRFQFDDLYKDKGWKLDSAGIVDDAPIPEPPPTVTATTTGKRA